MRFSPGAKGCFLSVFLANIPENAPKEPLKWPCNFMNFYEKSLNAFFSFFISPGRMEPVSLTPHLDKVSSATLANCQELRSMHDLIIAAAFLAIVLAPAILASRSHTSEGA
jgi:hypothetical protein